MTKLYESIIAITGLVILVAICVGIIIPTLISTKNLPVVVIVMLLFGLIAGIACLVIFLIRFLMSK